MSRLERKVTLVFHVRRSSRKTQTFDQNSSTRASRSEVKALYSSDRPYKFYVSLTARALR